MVIKSAHLAWVILFLGHAELLANLHWEKKSLKIKAAGSEEVVTASFHFKNTGEGPVFISEVRCSSAGLVAEKGVGLYQPGESGSLVFSYYTQGSNGWTAVNALVISSDSAIPTRLDLLVEVPSVLTLKPEMLVWSRGDGDKAKLCSLIEAKKGSIVVKHVYSTSTNFIASFRKDSASKYWLVQVAPVTTERTGSATIYMDVEVDGVLRKFSLGATIVAPHLATVPEGAP